MNKTCSTCGATKPLSEFSPNRLMRDGHLNRCRECCNAAHRANYHGSPTRREYLREKAKAWMKTEKGRAYRRVRDKGRRRTGRRRCKIKTRAWDTLRCAVKRGKIDKPSRCSVCQEPANVRDMHGHHKDYTKPLDVVWLCRVCHQAAHA